jgi:acyl-CoA thioester hydrolase
MTTTPEHVVIRSDFWFFHPFRVRYAEIDAQAVVFNAHYLTYFDTAITEYMRAVGYDQFEDAKVSGNDFHTVRALVEYKIPLRFDEQFDVAVRIGAIGNSSVTLALAVFTYRGHALHATGEIVWVNTDQQTHKPVRISNDVRQVLTRIPDLT